MQRRRVPSLLVRLGAGLIALVLLWIPLQSQSEPAALSSDLAAFLASNSPGTVRVISSGEPASLVPAGLRLGALLRRNLTNGAVFEVTREQLNRLRADSAFRHLSGDVPVLPTMDVTNTTVGADQVWAGWSQGLFGLVSYPGVTGKDIGIAIIDSGISNHPAVSNQIAASVNLASGATGTSDAFGHGTHVAGIAAGRKSAALNVTSKYSGGVAPDARLINVRVLDGNGVGYTSDVIAGIDWAIAHRQEHNIRVMNLSLGHPVYEACATDPLCQAVARAVSSGIAVVVSAGNVGRTPDGRPVLGGVTSPGNSPLAITVGAISTQGTTARSDDTLAAYSSRGPTRFDFGVKPDVVAPGTRLVAPEASDSWIARSKPAYHVAGPAANAYMTLSGTSMSAAVVSGGVALLLQANPNLTPQQVKLALQTTASFMPDAGLIGAGAGSINLRGARQVAGSGLLGGLVTQIAGQLLTASGVSYWDSGTLISRVYDGAGLRLLSPVQALLAWLNPNLLLWGDLNLLGVSNPIGSTAPNFIVWGEVADWSSSYFIVWGEQIQNPEGEFIVWGETESNFIVWGETTFPETE